MASIRLTDDGIVFDLSHQEVQDLLNAADVQESALALIASVLAFLGGAAEKIIAAAAAAIAATIAADKAQFQNAATGTNGAEALIPWWAVALGWWGAMQVKPLPDSAGTSSQPVLQPGKLAHFAKLAHPALFEQMSKPVGSIKMRRPAL